MRAVTLILFLSLSLVSMSGCAVVAVGALAGSGTYAYVSGWGEQNYNADIDDVYDAALSACNELRLVVKSQKRQLSKASIDADDSGTPVWITLERLNPRVTQVQVKVGLLGDDEASKRILETIQKAF